MNTAGRTFAGAVLGVLCASAAFSLTVFVHPDSRLANTSILWVALFTLPVMAILAGPGAVFLAWLHAELLGRFARHAGSASKIQRVGILLGLPLGMANLVFVFAVLGLLRGTEESSMRATSDWIPFVFSALAGGAGLGWGATLELKPGRRASKGPVRRVAPPVSRRDGPPFFDHRASRAQRRTS